ncbi:MAG: PIN domain-containing protein [Chloroflexi bacterium]|nr:PIN domain-containing protein [Chloroflexota bacterium]
MATYLADTMAVVRHFTGSRLGSEAVRIFRETDADRHLMLFSAVTLMEILYLSERQRIEISPAELIHRIKDSSNYDVLSLDADIILTAAGIDDVPELHDRLIAATAKFHGLQLITNDPVLAASKAVTTLW